ncbi:MAG: aminoacyl-histidine dipeptidase [Chthonomonadaceae bacterium]|nr:aminoacyl-histidine dipeptidase [Chthonomonadaceae bacterium]
MISTEATRVWKYFEELSRIPRGSTNEAGVRAWVRAFAATEGFDFLEDAAGNCLVAVPGRGRGVNAPPVIIQSHMDMVCVRAEESTHDFTRDPIRLQVATWEENGKSFEVCTADGTTLGADNGIGLTAAMAVAVDPEVTDCPPLELLFTMDEETGLTGARDLDPALLRADLLLNLDTEELGDICVSCAGGRDMTAEWAVHRGAPAVGEIPLSLSLTGLPGGHSGVEIHRPNGNAILTLLKEVLGAAQGKESLKLAALNGGSARNVIPSDAEIVVWVSEAQAKVLEEAFADPALAYRIQSTLGESAASIAVGSERKTPETTLAPISADRTRTLLDAIAAVPHGVQKWSEVVPDLVETSNNVAVVQTTEQTVRLICSTRSSRDGAIVAFQDRAKAGLESSGAKVICSEGYPGWPADPNNPLLGKAETVFEAVLGHRPNVMAVHAGLECGVFKGKRPSLQMISFGPDIQGAHTIHERVVIASIAPFYRCLTSLLKSLTV